MRRSYLVLLILAFVFQFKWVLAQSDDLTLDDSFETEVSEAAADPAASTATSEVTDASAEITLDDDDELTLEDEFVSAPTSGEPTASTNSGYDPKKSMQEYKKALKNMIILDKFPPMEQGVQPTENVNLASPLELRQNEGALYGWSMGVVGASQPLYLNYTRTATLTQEVNKVDQQTDPIQTVGFMLRYADTPYGSLGTDVNFSYAASLNHDSIALLGRPLKQFYIAKAELNFVYAIRMGNILPIYFLAGGGFETFSGGNIDELANPIGFGGQVGAGFAIASTLNLEAVYSYYEHKLANSYKDELMPPSGTEGLAAYSLDEKVSKVTNRGLIAKLTYSFKF